MVVVVLVSISISGGSSCSRFGGRWLRDREREREDLN